MAHRSEDLEERVDTGSTMAVTEGDLFCDKQITPNNNLRAANPKKRGEPEKSSKSKRSGDGAWIFYLYLYREGGGLPPLPQGVAAMFLSLSV